MSLLLTLKTKEKKIGGCCSVGLLTSSPLYAEVDNTQSHCACLTGECDFCLYTVTPELTDNVSGWIRSVTLSIEGKLLFHAFKEKNDVG